MERRLCDPCRPPTAHLLRRGHDCRPRHWPRRSAALAHPGRPGALQAPDDWQAGGHGRRTFESIGRPLPQRHNIVVTRDRGYVAEGCTIAHSIEPALIAAGNVSEIAIIGGAQIFEELLSADRRPEHHLCPRRNRRRHVLPAPEPRRLARARTPALDQRLPIRFRSSPSFRDRTLTCASSTPGSKRSRNDHAGALLRPHLVVAHSRSRACNPLSGRAQISVRPNRKRLRAMRR